MTTTPAPLPLQAQVEAEKVRLLYQQAPSAFVPNLVLAGGVVLVAGDGTVTRTAVLWFSFVVAAMVLRAALWLSWRRVRPGPEAAPRWGGAFALAMLANGIAWGSGAWVLFPPDQPLVQVGVTVIVVSLAAGITATTLASMPGVVAFLFAGVGPYAVAFAFEHTFFQHTIAVLIPVFVVGNALRARTNARTLTELLTLRLDVALQRDRAEQANIAKSKFLAAASHDLRQPLHAMTLFAGTLDDRLERPEDRKVLESLKGALAAMGKLFNALLDLSRLDAGTVEPRRVHFALGPLLDRLSGEQAPQAAQKGLQWRCPPTPLWAFGDPVLLETILRNLLSNAVRYTAKGHVTVSCAAGPDGAVAIAVEDSGVGIPPAQQAEIFREYHQLHNPERDGEKGLGLGLAIVDRLCRLLGHRLELQSVPGEGSRFTVHVPAGVRPTSDAGLEREEPLPGSELQGMAVLVIDDQESVRESMRVLLGGWGCAVSLADGPESAVAAARGPGGPELIVADYRLRDEHTGTAAIEQVRREVGRPVPALIITGDTAPERLKEAHAAGFVLMHKPVSPAKLRAFLRSVRRERSRPG